MQQLVLGDKGSEDEHREMTASIINAHLQKETGRQTGQSSTTGQKIKTRLMACNSDI